MCHGWTEPFLVFPLLLLENKENRATVFFNRKMQLMFSNCVSYVYESLFSNQHPRIKNHCNWFQLFKWFWKISRIDHPRLNIVCNSLTIIPIKPFPLNFNQILITSVKAISSKTNQTQSSEQSDPSLNFGLRGGVKAVNSA